MQRSGYPAFWDYCWDYAIASSQPTGLFAANGLEVEACENRCWEVPGGLTVKLWCELGDSGAEALRAIHGRLAAVPPEWLSELEITRDTDGEFRIPVRTLLILGRKLFD